MMRIVSILSKLLKTVGLLAVRLELDELQWKNRKKCRIFEKNLNFVILTKFEIFFRH